jgi:sarcosine oxidase subunit alpha
MAIASRLAAQGRAVEIIDDQLAPGGGVTALGATEAQAFEAIYASCMNHVTSGRIRMRSRTVAGGMYGRDLLVVGPDGAEVLEARALVLACGAHDGALAFEGNDVPGVMSARAAGWLLGRGVMVGKRVVVVTTEGGGPFGASFAAAAYGFADTTVVHGEPVRIRGASHVKAVVVRDASGNEKEHAADAVLIDAPRSPAYELAEQAGAVLVHEPRGFVVRTDSGRIDSGIFAVGEIAGTAFDAAAIDEESARICPRIE